MSNKKLAVSLLIVSVLVFLGFVVFKLTTKKAVAPTTGTDISLDQVVNNQQTQTEPQSQENQLQGSVTLTVTEVKKHNSATDCWTIINDGVYDITEYVSRHPGGDEILRACGADGTSLFVSRTTSDGESVGSGTPHSSNAQSQLDQFLLGKLVQ